jgi:DNA repair ATPase RecN
LIGQNESGKTSVLEALHSFYTNKINDDVLRSDNSLPDISCNFQIDGDLTVADFLKGTILSPTLYEILKDEKEFSLTRLWNDNKSSSLFISSKKVTAFFNEFESQEKTITEQTENEIENLLLESDNLLERLKNAENDKNQAQFDLVSCRKTIEEKDRLLKRAKKTDEKLFAENEAIGARDNFNKHQIIFNDSVEGFEKLKNQTQELSEKISIGKTYRQSKTNYFELKKSLKDKQRAISEMEHIYDLNTSDKDKKNILANLQRSRYEFEQSNLLLEQFNSELKRNLLIASKILISGVLFKQAESEAIQELSLQKQYLDKYQIGEELFRKIPVFEFFEDFSGLLPNKIDLEDILNNNHQVEGFKAAVNFLKIAGLDTTFFREKNHRILKQRIETLNGDVTINFQDYWSQQVGKDNKIRLHFELEHYDYTVPEKSGKPYLEFWIKDKQERLYPKQRSRGVRWFLSFYLELKAAAVKSENDRVLLIDEPGLSLHARAQEDVLKVFEDLKQSMQIIYCTHSPHLIKTEKLYRILAVQRADEEDDKSESIIYEPSMLSEASADTLTPIYSMMGIRLADQQFINSKNNIIVPDTIAYYYLHWLNKIIPKPAQINFIPATGPESIIHLINILSAWQIKFGVMLFGSEAEQLVQEIKELSVLENDISNKIKFINEYTQPEDIFSTIDFKKFILMQRTGITEKNSEFISMNALSRKILAANFVNNIAEEKINFTSFDETTQQNLKNLFIQITELL